MKRSFLLILVCALLLNGLVGCRKQEKMIEENAQNVANVFENHDMEAVNEVVFGSSSIKIDKELSDIWEENEQSQNSILTNIFELVTVKVKKVTDSTIEYKIKAPDMSKVFETPDIDKDNITEDELTEHIRNYARNAEFKTVTVSLDYVMVDNELIVNYQDESFINAVTGGLLDAYKSLYQEMLDICEE